MSPMISYGLFILALFTLQQTPVMTIHDFKTKTLQGETFDLSSLKGKKVMIVNTASKCGLTPQYKELQQLYSTYKDDNFIILGFPCNDFGAQEPGTSDQINTFCEINYGVTFPMMEKISVKGSDKHPIYQFLTEKAKNGKEDSKVQWNFQKYLIDESGHLQMVIAPTTSPLSDQIINWINS
jgi:glutathione peroxidase